MYAASEPPSGGTNVEPSPRIRSPVKQTRSSRKQTWSSAWPGVGTTSNGPDSTTGASRQRHRRRVVAVRVGQQNAADPAAPPRLLPEGGDMARVVGPRIDHIGRVRAHDVAVGALERHRPRVWRDEAHDLGMSRGRCPIDRAPARYVAADCLKNRVARVVGLEHHQVADALQDLAHEPVGRAVGELDHDGSVGELLDHGPLLAQPPGPLRRDPDARHARASPTSPWTSHSCSASRSSTPSRGSKVSSADSRLLHPVEPEVAGVVAAQVVAAQVPALGAADQLVGLDLALDELVLVLLVVVELEDPARPRSRR